MTSTAATWVSGVTRWVLTATALSTLALAPTGALAQACQWMYSSGGAGNFRNLALGPELSALRFGDFDGDRKTDVFSVACP